jgi:Asp-tRNA(Asn)/Glu-tRNA(Gln) amidotransferase A subunit family amidase
VAGGYFAEEAEPEALEAVETIAQVLQKRYGHAPGSLPRVHLPESERARAAAYVITAAESANLHLKQLRSRPQDFDPATRDRFLAGAMIPSAWLLQAQRFRSWYRDRVREVFQHVDLILAPTTPCVAPTLEQARQVNLGRFTQPLSLIGLPVLSIPVHRPNALPLGVQIIASPYDEAVILRVANYLERQGIIAAPIASL